jgi:hypothetical protein
MVEVELATADLEGRRWRMPDQLVQLSKRTGGIDGVPQAETPIVELHVVPGQYIAGVELKPHVLVHSKRKTVDWSWTAYVVTPPGGPDA